MTLDPIPVRFVETDEFTDWYTPEKQVAVDRLVDAHRHRIGPHPVAPIGREQAVRALWVLDHPESFPPRRPRPSEVAIARAMATRADR